MGFLVQMNQFGLNTGPPQSSRLFLLVVALLITLILSIASASSPEINIIRAQAQGAFQVPARILHANDTLIVSWNGAGAATVGDAINIHTVPVSVKLPVDDEHPKKNLIGFHKVYELDPYLTGSGGFSMPVFAQVDTAFYFEYVRYAEDGTGKTLFWSQLVHTNTDCWAFHLAFTHNPSQYRLMYQSQSFEDQHWIHLTLTHALANEPKFQVKNSTQNGFFPAFSSARDTYVLTDMKEPPASEDKYFLTPAYTRNGLLDFHTATGIDYFYTIRNAAGDRISRVFVATSPKLENKNKDTDVFIFGDSGAGVPFYTQTDQQQTSLLTYESIAKVLGDHRRKDERLGKTPLPTHILHMGDLSYSRGYAFLNEYFFQQIEPLSSRFPYMVSIGNHEYCYTGQPWKPDWHACNLDSGGEGAVPYFTRWEMPPDFCITKSDGSKDCITDQQTEEYAKNGMRNIAYSYDVGAIHFLVYTLELDFLASSAQFAFIEKDLASVDRAKTPWVIVASHRPMYCSSARCVVAPGAPPNQHPNRSMDLVQRGLYQPLMVKYGVNVVMAGHTHQYERYKLMGVKDYDVLETWYNPSTSQREPIVTAVDGIETIKSVAPLHIVSGAAGNEHNAPWQTYMKGRGGEYGVNFHQSPDHLVFRTMSFGYSHFRANATHLIGKWYANADTTLHDHFILEKVPGY